MVIHSQLSWVAIGQWRFFLGRSTLEVNCQPLLVIWPALLWAFEIGLGSTHCENLELVRLDNVRELALPALEMSWYRECLADSRWKEEVRLTVSRDYTTRLASQGRIHN